MSRVSCLFSTCPTWAGIPQRRRRATLSASASGEAGSQDAGSRQLTAAEARSLARCRETPTWHLVTLPAVPVYCRDTHAEASPSFKKPVSSTINASTPIASCILQASRARACAGSHGLEVMKCASACRLPSSPNRAAIHSTDLRRPSSSSPRTCACPHRPLIRTEEPVEQPRRERLQVPSGPRPSPQGHTRVRDDYRGEFDFRRPKPGDLRRVLRFPARGGGSGRRPPGVLVRLPRVQRFDRLRHPPEERLQIGTDLTEFVLTERLVR
jgi:hypothetical protein